MQKLFQDVAIGTTFRFNNQDYVKIQNIKVSCCRSVNCHKVNSPNDRHFIQPQQKVEVDN